MTIRQSTHHEPGREQTGGREPIDEQAEMSAYATSGSPSETGPPGSPPGAGASEEGPTITITGRAVLGTALAVAVVAGGFTAGRSAFGPATGEAAGATVGSSVTSASKPALQPPSSADAPASSGALSSGAPSSAGAPSSSGSSSSLRIGPDGEIAPGKIIKLGDDSHPLVGAKPFEIEGELLDGQRVRLTDYIGQPLLINFWATWCPPCRIEMPWLEEAYRKYKDQGFVILAVDAGERVPPDMTHKVVSDFATEMGLTFPIMLPDDPYGSQRQYMVYGIPTSYLINREGIIVAVHRGMFPNRVTLDAQLQTILGEH